jgi:hypothetical protein
VAFGAPRTEKNGTCVALLAQTPHIHAKCFVRHRGILQSDPVKAPGACLSDEAGMVVSIASTMPVSDALYVLNRVQERLHMVPAVEDP